jgi:ABC-type multidrug transport system ATPase subunit
MNEPPPVLSLRGVDAPPAPGASTHLRALNLDCARGELCILLGAPDDGGPTLLRVLAGLARPSSGAVIVDGRDLATASPAELAAFRRGVGLALGAPYDALLPAADPRTNVELALRLRGLAPREARSAADAALLALDLAAERRVARVLPASQARLLALAVALAGEPPLLLLEEPAAGLDGLVADDVWQLLRARTERGATVIVATADAALAARAPRCIVLQRGRAVTERVRRVAFARGSGDELDEYAVLDADGALTLSAAQLREAGIAGRALVTPGHEHLELRREPQPSEAREPRWRPRTRQ